MTIRPRRSMLYMPGSNARAIEKARELPVDGVILDLEDAVAPDAKAQARELVVQALQKGGFGRPRGRGAGPDQRARYRLVDRRSCRCSRGAGRDPGAEGLDALEQLRELARHFVGVGAEARIRVWAMMETPLAMLNARDIAAAAGDRDTRLAGFVMGTNDLAKDTRARIVPGRAPMLPWLMTCIAAARAYGLAILDGVYNELGDLEGFAAECGHGAAIFGFDGKTLIHPQQISKRQLQCRVLAGAGRGRLGAQDHRRLRPSGKCRQGGHPDRRPHGRAAARGDGAAGGGDRRGRRADAAGLKPARRRDQDRGCGVPPVFARRTITAGIAKDGIYTQITAVKLPDENQQAVVELMIERARFMATQPGFVSVNLHLSRDGLPPDQLRAMDNLGEA